MLHLALRDHRVADVIGHDKIKVQVGHRFRAKDPSAGSYPLSTNDECSTRHVLPESHHDPPHYPRL